MSFYNHKTEHVGSDMINFGKTKIQYLLNILWRFHSFLFPQNIEELMNMDNTVVIVGGVGDGDGRRHRRNKW